MCIMKHPDIDPAQVQRSLRHVPRHVYESELSFRQNGAHLSEDELVEIDALTEDGGDGITTPGFRHLQIADALRGSALTLRDRTLIRYQPFVIPQEVTKENVEALMYNRLFASIAFTTLHINETGVNILGKVRAKPVVSRAYETEGVSFKTRIHPSAQAITKYLNGSMSGNDDSSRLVRMLQDTLKYISDIRFEERAYVDSVIEIVLAKGNRSDD